MPSENYDLPTSRASGNGNPINPSLERIRNQRENLGDSTPQKEAFKKSINDKNFFEAFAVVVKDLTQLKITTIVEDEFEEENTWSVPVKELEGKPGKRLVTIIDLINGDITNIVGNRFINNQDYTTIRDQHIEQVAKGQDIIKSNLGILQSALKELIELGKATGTIKSD